MNGTFVRKVPIANHYQYEYDGLFIARPHFPDEVLHVLTIQYVDSNQYAVTAKRDILDSREKHLRFIVENDHPVVIVVY